MDNICHTLTGAALGRAGLASRTRFGMATLMIAANLPDVDVAVFLTDTLPVSFRRGWTHGVLAQMVLPVALAGVVWAIGRRPLAGGGRQRADGRGQAADAPVAPDAPARPSGTAPLAPVAPVAPVAPALFLPLLLLSYIGLYSHIALDYMNSYGVRLLMPFSGRWFYGDALYIVDPWMYLILGAGVWLAGRARSRGAVEPWRPARVALVAATVYALAMLGSSLWARSEVRAGLQRAGQAGDTRFMVTPVMVNPFRREVLVDTGGRYEKGTLWFEPLPHFRPEGYGVDRGFDQPEARTALATPRAQAFLGWARFPFFVVDRSEAPARVWLNDYRYSDATGRAGWAGFAIRVDDSPAGTPRAEPAAPAGTRSPVR